MDKGLELTVDGCQDEEALEQGFMQQLTELLSVLEALEFAHLSAGDSQILAASIIATTLAMAPPKLKVF